VCGLVSPRRRSWPRENLTVGPENQGIHGRDGGGGSGTLGGVINELPDPVLTQVYGLKAVMGPQLDFGDVLAGRRRVVPLVGGTFTGPELNGNLLPGGSASWQIVSPGGAALAEIRYTLQTDCGALLYVQSSGVGQGDPGERLFRAVTRIETAARHLDWLNKGVFITVAGRTAVSMLYETYLVG
jgi:Protein of unknown function (DUF3237)